MISMKKLSLYNKPTNFPLKTLSRLIYKTATMCYSALNVVYPELVKCHHTSNTGIQWYKNGIPIPNANQEVLVIEADESEDINYSITLTSY